MRTAPSQCAKRLPWSLARGRFRHSPQDLVPAGGLRNRGLVSSAALEGAQEGYLDPSAAVSILWRPLKSPHDDQ